MLLNIGHYRPQRSCGKVIFSRASVSHSVHRRGEGVSGRHPQADTLWADTLPGQTLSLGRHTPCRHPRADIPPCPVHAGIHMSCSVHADIHPPNRQPPCPVHAGIHTPVQCMLEYTPSPSSHCIRWILYACF